MTTESPVVDVGDDQKKTFREFFKTYNTMSEFCFNRCVWDFGTEVVRNREDRCVMKCVQHYMDASKEIGRVFADEQASMIVKDHLENQQE